MKKFYVLVELGAEEYPSPLSPPPMPGTGGPEHRLIIHSDRAAQELI